MAWGPKGIALIVCVLGVGAGAVMMSALTPNTDLDAAAAAARARSVAAQPHRAKAPVAGWTPPDFELPGPAPAEVEAQLPDQPPPRSPTEIQADIDAAVAEALDQGDLLYPPDMAGLARAVQDKNSAIQACARSSSGYKGSAGPQGQLMVSFQIVQDPDSENEGFVDSVRVNGDGEPTVFDRCLSAVFRTMDFRAPPIDDLSLQWPITIR